MIGPVAIRSGTEWVTPVIARHDGAEWVSIQGGSSGATPVFTADGGTVSNIGNNLAQIGARYAHGATGTAAITKHMLHANETSLTLVWASRTLNMISTSAETELRAAVRSPSTPQWVDVKFSGASSVLIPPANSALDFTSDPVVGQWRAGEELEVLAHGRVTTADGTGTGAITNGSAWTKDPGVLTNTSFAAAKTAVFAARSGPTLRPTLILGRTLTPSKTWLAIGDSITSGAEEGYHSHVERALYERGQKYTLSAQGGSAYRDIVDKTYSNYDQRGGRLIKAGYVDSVLSAHGINDGEDVIPNAVKVWSNWKADGADRIVQVTLFPAVASGGTARAYANTFNAWLRDGAPIIGTMAAATGTTDPTAVRATFIDASGVVRTGNPAHPLGSGWITDMAAPVETTLGSGLWKIGVGVDTLHPNQTAHEIAATTIARDLQLMGF